MGGADGAGGTSGRCLPSDRDARAAPAELLVSAPVPQLRRALDRLGLEPHEAVYVGDTAGDMRAAAKAGMQAIGAAWAQTATVNQGNGTAPLHVFHRVEDFRRWINETFAPGQKADDADPRS